MAKSLIGCKYCAMERGITIKDCFETEEELFDHLEMAHDLVIKRKNETEEEAKIRIEAKNPRMGTENCQCPTANRKGKYYQAW